MIPERDKITGSDYEYTYSCNCGWIDWKHANPDVTANRIISLVTQAYEYYAREGNNARVAMLSAYDLSHNISVPIPGLDSASVGTFHDDIYIGCSLTQADILPVAMAIFRAVEAAHEGSIPSQLSSLYADRWTNYAEEDLASNLIAFYRAVYPAYNARYGEDACLPVICDYPSDESVGQQWSMQVFDEYGEFQRIYDWEAPRLHSTPAIDSRCSGRSRQWPAEFRTIQPDFSLWRAIQPFRSGESLYNSLILSFGMCGVRGIHRISLGGSETSLSPSTIDFC